MNDPIQRLIEDPTQCALCRGLLQGLDINDGKQNIRAVCFEGHLERMHGWKREEEAIQE